MLPFVEVFGRQIPMYAVCIMAGLTLGILVGVLRAGIYGNAREDVLFASFYGILGLVAGGKLLYLITVLPALWGKLPEVLGAAETLQALMGGGFVFYGGLLGALGGIWIYTRQYRLRFVTMLENLMPSIPLIHGFGRLGCFCAGCCYGIPVQEPWGVVFARSPAAPGSIPLFPVQLVEAAGNFVLFAALLLVFGKRRTCGQITAVYMLCYSVMRFCLEFVRADAERGIWLGISTSQWISIGILAAGLWLAVRVRARAKM